jgi:glucose/mannose transport system substrate-binding protein
MIGLLLCGTVLLGSPALAEDAKLKAEVFSSWTSGGEAAAAKVIADEFNKRGGQWSDASIAGFENANAAFQNRMVAGDPPTVKQFVVGLDPIEYVEQGMVVPIDDVATAGKWASVMPKPLIDAITYDGKIYLAPTGIHGESWMFFSNAAFEKAGIADAPKTWDAFFADMDKLKAAGLVPIAWGGQAWQEVKVFNAILLSQVGLEGFKKVYVDKDEATLKSPAFAKTLEIFGRMRGYVDGGAPGRNWNDATSMVITGKAGVQFMGDWAKGEFAGAGQTAGKEFGCSLAPESDAMVYISDAFGFPKIDKPEQQAAQKLMAEVVLDPKVQVEFSLKKGSIPVRTDVDTSKLDACAKTGLEMLSAGKIAPDHAIVLSPNNAGTLTDLIGEYWSDPTIKPDDMVKRFTDMLAAG